MAGSWIYGLDRFFRCAACGEPHLSRDVNEADEAQAAHECQGGAA